MSLGFGVLATTTTTSSSSTTRTNCSVNQDTSWHSLGTLLSMRRTGAQTSVQVIPVNFGRLTSLTV